MSVSKRVSCPPPLAGLGTVEGAAVVLETIPATYGLGFPLPAPGYLAGVKRAWLESRRWVVLSPA